MASAHPSAEDTERLLAVQTRVRSLIHAHPGLREAMKVAWPQFLELTRIHLRDKWSASRGQASGGDEPIESSPRSLAPDPRELERANLRRFSDPDRRTIVLARLAWLADVGEPLPIIEEVPRSGDPEDLVIRYVSELAVAPVDGVGDSAMELGTPRPCHFPPRIAEAFLRHLEEWVARGCMVPKPEVAGEAASPGRPRAVQGGVAQPAEKSACGLVGGGPKVGVGETHPTLLKRPVPVSAAAKVASKRSDVLLRMLRARQYPIGGVSGAYIAELEHIVVTVPRKRQALMRWADENYKVDR